MNVKTTLCVYWIWVKSDFCMSMNCLFQSYTYNSYSIVMNEVRVGSQLKLSVTNFAIGVVLMPFIVNFEHISHLVLVFLLLTLNMQLLPGISRVKYFFSSYTTLTWVGHKALYMIFSLHWALLCLKGWDYLKEGRIKCGNFWCLPC